LPGYVNGPAQDNQNLQWTEQAY